MFHLVRDPPQQSLIPIWISHQLLWNHPSNHGLTMTSLVWSPHFFFSNHGLYTYYIYLYLDPQKNSITSPSPSPSPGISFTMPRWLRIRSDTSAGSGAASSEAPKRRRGKARAACSTVKNGGIYPKNWGEWGLINGPWRYWHSFKSPIFAATLWDTKIAVANYPNSHR